MDSEKTQVNKIMAYIDRDKLKDDVEDLKQFIEEDWNLRTSMRNRCCFRPRLTTLRKTIKNLLNTSNETMTTTKTKRDDSQQTKYENLDKLNLSQPFNKVQYHCKDCEEIWNTSEDLKEFTRNQEDYSGYITMECHKIFRSIHENLFRPEDRLIGTVCPNCCAEHERKSGNIETSLEGRKTDEQMLERLAENHGLYFEQALKKLWHVGKEINHDGEVTER